MPSSFNPPVDLHSPTAIGDVAPNTVRASSIVSDGLIDVAAIGMRIGTAFYLQASSNGVMILIDGGGNPMDRVIFGQGGTSSPSLKPSGAVLQARTNDGTGFTLLQGKLTCHENAATGLVAGVFAAATNATVPILGADGTIYDVPAKAR